MATSFLHQNYIFRIMTEDVAEKCGDYTCKYDGEIEEFFKSEYKDYNTQLLGKHTVLLQEMNIPS